MVDQLGDIGRALDRARRRNSLSCTTRFGRRSTTTLGPGWRKFRSRPPGVWLVCVSEEGYAP
jgi:hypothetical protein